MTRRLIAIACTTGLAALAWTAVSAADPAPNPDKQCKKGYVRGAEATAEHDANGNGYVCVDEDGTIRDDKDQFAGDGQGNVFAADENGNHIVCSNNGVYVDDDGAGGCPPGFGPGPVLTPALAADENGNFIVCRNDADGSYVDDTIGSDCPPGYTLRSAIIG